LKAIGIIPARMGASRFPGKPLEPILGMPLLGHCYFRTKRTPGLSEVYVATCDFEIAKYVESIGGKVIMTSHSHDRASTRTSEALELIEKKTNELIDVVLMVQGDEPLVSSGDIQKVINIFNDHPTVEIANIMSRFRSDQAFSDRNNVKVVFDKNSNALYFSREAIPSDWKNFDDLPRFMQTGIIGFTRDALLNFNTMEETCLEKHESVDLNRVIENGGNVRMVPVERFMIGVDTPAELEEAGQWLEKDDETSKYLLD
jgi:3-deoxy-manno-octulosonate cytidylyltransferase (CMP-KDO synthetase)